jgi:hypothetical protein
MKKYLIGLSIVATLVACSKSGGGNNSGTVTFYVNGQSYSNSSNNLLQLQYFSGKQSVAYFTFQSLDFQLGNQINTINQTYGTDSLQSNYVYFEQYPQQFSSISINNIDISTYSIFHIYTTVTSLTSTTASGTFTGNAVGINSTTGATVTDSITNGVFTNVPILRTYN